MGKLNTLDPATVRAFETYLGLPVDGTYDPELAARVEAYQGLLGQTPGQTDSMEQYSALVSALQQRHNAFGGGGDPTPMQDPGYQAFLREAGARESEILDEIAYRTEQNTREINRRAAGFAAERADVQANAALQTDQGTRRIRQDYADRGFGGGSSARDQQVGDFVGGIQQETQQRLGGIDQEQLNFTAGQNDALSEARRRLNSDANALYRRRVDEDLNARKRISDAANQRAYGG